MKRLRHFLPLEIQHVIVPFLLAMSSNVVAGQRVDVSIGENWRFLRMDIPGAETTAFPDSTWDLVSLPHTWNARER